MPTDVISPDTPKTGRLTPEQLAQYIWESYFYDPDDAVAAAEDAAIRARWQASYDEEERQHREARARGEELWRAWQRRDP